MKARHLSRFQARTQRRGMALLLVLAAVAFVSILTVTFLLSVNHELVSSKSYASGASTRIYADAAVNLVIGQLQAGTTLDDATKTWVSQPGMIRTFNNSTGGKMLNAYKLYSSAKMVDDSTFTPLTATGDPADVPSTWTSGTAASDLPWVKDPNLYADLNSPVTINSVTKYPVLNPGGLNTATPIEGFSVSSLISGNAALANQIPMPVTWLYILTDGRIATPSATPGDSTAVTLTTPDGQPVAASNPPVARVAYWTDDNTCRLDINTASEGNFWTMPYDEVGGDAHLSRSQITSNEYQRYPGHPATTSLSPVFNFLKADATDLTKYSSDLRNLIFTLTPRVSGRGSQFGARQLGFGKTVNPDTDRLYASVDELLFLPKVNAATGQRYTTTTANIQAIDTALPDAQRHLDWNFTSNVQTSMTGTAYSFTNNFTLDSNRLELARFFLTANSRAPEINLFGQPRISLWPIDTRASYQSSWDKTLAFTSTIGGHPYYFQRQNPSSLTDDYTLIPRNQELMAYLDHLTSTAIPGFGGNFAGKYPAADWAQVKTSMFDWIRTVNLGFPDMTGAVNAYAWTKNSASTTAMGAFIPPGNPGSGQVLPIKINSTQGYGRFPTLSKAGIGIIRESEVADSPSVGRTTVNYRVVFLMETYVPTMGYAGYVPNYYIRVGGLANAFNLVTKTTTPAASASATVTRPVDFQDGAIHVTAPSNFEVFSGRAWGGTQGFNNLFLYSDSGNNNQLTARLLGNADPNTGYPFVSSLLSVDYPTADRALIQVGISPKLATTATVNISLYDETNSQKVADFTTPFDTFPPLNGAFLATTVVGSNVTVAADGKSATGTGNTAADLKTRLDDLVKLSKVIDANNGTGTDFAIYKNVIGRSDVVRGVELNHGDLRLTAIQGTDANSKFVAHREYLTTSKPHAHSLLCSGGNAIYASSGYTTYDTSTKTGGSYKTAIHGSLVPNTITTPATDKNLLAYGSFLPQCPSLMSTAKSIAGFTGPGDFSTGLGSEGDGPHIMKADEGNSSSFGPARGQSMDVPYQNQFFPFDARLALAFSPNRQISSAVQFGTLPSQPKSPKPWQTLLFRPDFDGTHPGANSPSDSLLLDLFWMPVTDPYPISEQFSTAGKVNMNYQILPFTYINRSTAMIGALKATKIGALTADAMGKYDHGLAEGYKQTAWVQGDPVARDKEGKGYIISTLYEVDPVKTLTFFDERFTNTDPTKPNIFKSPSEICSIPLAPAQNTRSLFNTGFPAPYSLSLIPEAATYAIDIYGAANATDLRTKINEFWSKNTLTGDNVLEAPYNALYPRLTTQSNTYTVYVRAQALKVTGTSTNGVFTRVQDRVTGEYRGSYEVERYLDINDSTIPDFADSTNYSKTIYPYYKFRILSNKQFIP